MDHFAFDNLDCKKKKILRPQQQKQKEKEWQEIRTKICK
jgi:hypothetical protein